MNNSDYNSLLLPGETFYSGHTRLTLLEIKDAIKVFKAANRLPNCVWEDIKHCHATTAATIWALTARYNEMFYNNTIGVDKPSRSFLEWIYNGLKEATK